MSGLLQLKSFRSLSRYGLSQATVVFKDGTDIHFARQLVSQRLQDTREELPSGAVPEMGPIATGLSEIYSLTVETVLGAKKPDGSPYTPTDLRDVQDWIIKPQLRNVPGVTEINSIGGFNKEFLVAPNPNIPVFVWLEPCGRRHVPQKLAACNHEQTRDDQRGPAQLGRRNNLAKNPECQEQRDHNASLVDQRDGGDVSEFNSLVIEYPGRCRGHGGRREPENVSLVEGLEFLDRHDDGGESEYEYEHEAGPDS